MIIQNHIPQIQLFFQEIKLRMGIGFSADYLNPPSTPLNRSSNSVISRITTPFSFSNMDQNDSSVRNSAQYESSKYFPDNSIYFEDKT